MLDLAKWIRPERDFGDPCPMFKKSWKETKNLSKATLYITALGVYEAKLNGKRIGEDLMAPGWTAYDKRLQYQEYDITGFLKNTNTNDIQITVGKGWYRSPMPCLVGSKDRERRMNQECGLLAEIHISYDDGSESILATDSTWLCTESNVRFSEIYDGEIFDATYKMSDWQPVQVFERSKGSLIAQEGVPIRETGRVAAKSIVHTPAGETLIDFGQEITGVVEFSICAEGGENIQIQHGEVLDKKGNFYNENYREAKAEIRYKCKKGNQVWHPILTFFGFRYIKLTEFPKVDEITPSMFTAIVIGSKIKQTGHFNCSNKKINKLFENILWGQKGNFLDVPTDCPQRDERLGWTGDAQVFVKAASNNYDCEQFFQKWLHDLSAEQRSDGSIGQIVPDYLPEGGPSTGYGDAATICPWQIYQTYGNKIVLKEQFESMKGWVNYITSATTTPNLWTGGTHFGDWLGLDAPSGSYKGSSRDDLIASAFYAHSTFLVIQTGKILNEDIRKYELLYQNILASFRKTYPTYQTQTERVLAIQFELASNLQQISDDLAEMILEDGGQLRTGFIGTPYILHALSKYGHQDVAYSLLLREDYPSWLYSVNKGATTIWEHWDGIMENGEFWSADMNSFNHYAYGSVADWLYEVVAGILPLQPGFKEIQIAPKIDARLGWADCSIDTRNGTVSSKWVIDGSTVRYDITTPVNASIIINSKEIKVAAGNYTFWDEI